METVVANLAGKTRRATLNGRRYIVAPLTMIVPGVLAGSKGPLLYPPEEVGRDPSIWNHMPITVGHPVVNGEPVSARHPDVLEKQGIGYVFNSHYDGKLRAEGWFEEEATRRVDSRIWTALEANSALELSTGVFTENIPATNDANHNGKGYVATAKNYKADHLATLVDSVGACSRQDGCGVLVNEGDKGPALLERFVAWLVGNADKGAVPSDAADVTPEKACQILKDGAVHGHELTESQRGFFGAICGQRDKTNNESGDSPMDRKQTVAWLTTNCDCWKGQEVALNGLADDKLTAMKVGAEKVLKEIAENEKLKAALASPLSINGREVTLTFNAAAGTLSGSMGSDTAPLNNAGVGNATTGSGTTHLSGNSVVARPPTDEEWLASAPPRIRSAVTNAIRIENDARQELVGRLTAIAESTPDPRRKSLITNKLKSNPPLDVLEELMVLVGDGDGGNGQTSSPLFPNYFGAAGGPVTANARDDSDNVLPEHKVDWSQQRQTA